MTTEEQLIQDWIENIPWEQLDKTQKNTVLKFMDPDEYKAMHSAHEYLHQYYEEVPSTINDDSTKHTLLTAFAQNKISSPLKNTWWKTPIPLWQTAAAFLLFATAVWLILPKNKTSIQQVAYQIKDTVYIEKKTENPLPKPVKTAQENTSTTRKYSTQKPLDQAPTIASKATSASIGILEGVHITSIKEYEDNTKPKENASLKDEPWVRNFGYVRN